MGGRPGPAVEVLGRHVLHRDDHHLREGATRGRIRPPGEGGRAFLNDPRGSSLRAEKKAAGWLPAPGWAGPPPRGVGWRPP